VTIQFSPVPGSGRLPCWQALLIVAWLALTSGCAGVTHFGTNKTIHGTAGKTTTATINVQDWQQADQLVLVPGGPYAENQIALSGSPGMITASGQQVVATDGAAAITILDFGRHPARQLGQMTLPDTISALHIHNKVLFVALQTKGLVVLDISNPANPQPVARFDGVNNVTRLKSHNDNVYALADHRKLVEFTPEPDNPQQPWRRAQTMTLPAASTDFAIAGNNVLLIGKSYGIGAISTTVSTTFIDTLPLQGDTKALHVRDKTAYVADGTGGLVVADVSDSGTLTWMGSHNKFDTVDDVYISGKRAFVIDRGIRVATLDIARKSLPITGSFYKPDNRITDLAVTDGTVYVATVHGIEQVAFPLQDHAQISNEGINQGGTRRAFIDNDIAYVADWFSGLHIYDISDPTQPRHIANYHTPGSSKGVVVDNGYAYVGDDDHGLQIIDVSHPEHPKKIASLPTSGLAYTLKKVGDLVYLADHRGGFDIIDVSKASHPVMKASYDTAGKSWAIDVKGNTAFVADDTSGILIFDVSNPSQPRPIGQFNPQGAAEDIVIKGNLAYTSFFDKGFYILDISDPASPKVISHIPVPGNARSVDIKDGYAYVAGWESGLNIIDISDPAKPQIIGRYDTKGSAWGADIHKGYAYVWDWWGGVKVVDVTNPRQPKLAGKYHTRGLIHNLRKKGNYIYTANGHGGVQVFDIKNPLNPIWATGIDLPGEVYDVWPSADTPYLFAADGKSGLQVLEISNPFYIYDLDHYLTGGSAVLVREQNKTVYVANKEGTLAVFNAREPFQLELMQTLAVTVSDIWIDNGVLFVASPKQGLLSFAVESDGKLNPHHNAIHNTASQVLANQNLLVGASDTDGIMIWQRKNNNYQALATISQPEPVLDMHFTGHDLLVYTRNQGLLVYDISQPAEPRLYARYPATDINQHFMVHNNGVFFGGTHTIASVQRLPELHWKPRNGSQLEVTVPRDLPVGNYHLMLKDAKGNEHWWPNALQVTLPPRTKPKMSMEKFKKLYKQYRSQQPSTPPQ
jgi:hypothetical protein